MRAEHDGRPLRLGGPKQRLVFAILLSRVNEVVSTDRLIDDLWNDDPPPTARQTLQAYVSTLRGVLEPCRAGTVIARTPGYIAQLDAATFDVLRFERLASEGRALTASDPETATSVLRQAEAMWHGDAYGDLTGAPCLAPEVQRLSELRVATSEARVDAELSVGQHAAVISDLEALVDAHPLREGLRGQLMVALYRSGRQAEALRVYQRTRHVLGEELGIEPTRELQRLEELILLHDENLAANPHLVSPVVPEVHYTSTPDGVSIAHYSIGTQTPDLLYIPGWVSNIETIWEHELSARLLDGFASFSRLICFDKRGTGLSDRVPPGDLPNLDTRASDIQAVLDAEGSETAVLFGVSEGGPIAALFAATYPERTTALILYGSYASRQPSPDYPWAPSPEARARWLDYLEREWGGEADLRTLAPSMQDDETFRTWWSRYLRSGASPSAVAALGGMNTEIDIRDIVASIDTPTLVMHRTGDRDNPVEGGRWLARHIPGAHLVEFDGDDHMPQINSHQILETTRTFLQETAWTHPNHQ